MRNKARNSSSSNRVQQRPSKATGLLRKATAALLDLDFISLTGGCCSCVAYIATADFRLHSKRAMRSKQVKERPN